MTTQGAGVILAVGTVVKSVGEFVRVVGYVREAPSLEEGESAFAQSEHIRRWVADSGHHLVATCQDGRDPTQPLGRDGFRALLDIARSGSADAVAVSSLSVLSPDKVTQEVILDHLRDLGLTIVSVDRDDHDELFENPDDHTRLIVRDVISKVDHFRKEFVEDPPSAERPTPPDVIVQLLPGGRQRDDSAAQTARPTA